MCVLWHMLAVLKGGVSWAVLLLLYYVYLLSDMMLTIQSSGLTLQITYIGPLLVT